MKAKLSKEGGGYDLYRIDEDGKRVTFASTQYYKQKLSLKNCQSIERGYDLDELIEEVYPTPIFGLSIERKRERASFKAGFQKALGILGDKKFSEEDVLEISWELFRDNPNIKKFSDFKKCFEEHIQSLQQTEWDCIVEMECCGNYNPPCNINCGYGPKQKLDADGCLILRKI